MGEVLSAEQVVWSRVIAEKLLGWVIFEEQILPGGFERTSLVVSGRCLSVYKSNSSIGRSWNPLEEIHDLERRLVERGMESTYIFFLLRHKFDPWSEGVLEAFTYYLARCTQSDKLKAMAATLQEQP